MHFHDGATADGRFGMVPIGEGIIDHRRAVELLASVSYEGFLSGEWISWEPHEQHLPREIAVMRAYEASVS